MRLLVVCIIVTVVCLVESTNSKHRFKQLTSRRTRSVAECSDIEPLFKYDLPPILKPRVPGTPSHAEVKQYIITRLEQLGPRWKVTLDSFSSQTPLGEKSFTNIVATLDPHIDRRLVLSAHYDTKIIDGSTTKFLGATDSALPCALLLDMAHALNTKLQARKLEEISLQLIFFDGEEAFVRWTNQDSIYGSRHLAEEMAKDNGLLSIGAKTGIKAMEAMVLLDLIGAKLPAFQNFFDETRPLYEQLAKIEERLHKVDHLEGHSKSNIYFPSPTLQYGRIEDDHIPFLKKGMLKVY